MIKAVNLHKYYDTLHVLKGVDLHIKKGEIVSIVGASGAGKTTLLQILGTLDDTDKNNPSLLTINDVDLLELQNIDNDNLKRKNSFKFLNILGIIYLLVLIFLMIKLNGVKNSEYATILKYFYPLKFLPIFIFLYYYAKLSKLKNKKDKDLSNFRNLNLGFIFQFHQLLPEFTALENVYIPALIAKRDKKEAEKEAEKLLNYLGLSHRLHHKPSELSGGEQQRVAVARALINKPAVIFADEPSGNLDTASAENLHQLFFKLRDEFGQTFVIVTHNEELANMADRKLVMVDGKIVNEN